MALLPPPPPSNNPSDPAFRDWFFKVQQILSVAGSIPHNDLGSIQGGTSGEYYHLTSSEYTGTGTGDFVRETNPTIVSPNIDEIDFNLVTTSTSSPGKLFWDDADGNQTLSLGMAGGNVTQQIGEELYFRVKASSAITNGQVVMFTGTVGNSGAITAAPATGLTPDQAIYIVGVATEDITLNSWGYVTYFGLVRGIDTTGTSVGETWADGTVLYYNPSITGGFTDTKPTVPNAIVVVAAVIKAHANGSIIVRPTYGSVLGGTDGNVHFTTLNDFDIIKYDATQQRWENSTLTAGTNIAITNGGPTTTISLTGTVDETNGGTGNSTYTTGDILYASASNTLSKLPIGSEGEGLLVTSGIPAWGSVSAQTKVYEPSVVAGFDTNVTYTGSPTVPSFVTDSNGDVIMAWGGDYAA